MLTVTAGADAPIVCYLAHPVGAPDAAGVEANLGAASRWLRYLMELPDVRCRAFAWSLPWYAYAQTFDDRLQPFRQRGLRDALAGLERCDAVLVLGRLTPGVTLELAAATARGMPIANLVSEGPIPPPQAEPNWWARVPHRRIVTELHGLLDQVEARRAGAARATA